MKLKQLKLMVDRYCDEEIVRLSAEAKFLQSVLDKSLDGLKKTDLEAKQAVVVADIRDLVGIS
jgi:hypothetical protein